MIVLWAAVVQAQVADPRSPRDAAAVRAVGLDQGRDGMRATAAEAADAWTEACRLGWRPACDPAAFVPTCDSDDAVSCLVFAWQQQDAGDHDAQAHLEHTCDAGLSRACADLGARIAPDDPARAGALWDAACDAGVGSACRTLGTPDRACALGDGLGCEQAGDMQQACTLGVPRACAALGADLGGTAVGGRAIALAYQRACDLGDPAGCTALGQILAAGRGLPADPDEADRRLLLGCSGGDGAGCTALARRILDGDAAGLARAPRGLYAEGCARGDPEACRREARFDIEQRRNLLDAVGGGVFRGFATPTLRPYLGGSVAAIGVLAVPKVDAVEAHRRLRVVVDVGAGDFTLGVLDHASSAENHSSLAVDWSQDGRPWGLRVAAGGFVWSGAPDDRGIDAPWPAPPVSTYDVSAFVPRLDLSHEARSGSRIGWTLWLTGAAWRMAHADVVTTGLHGRFGLTARQGTARGVVPMAGGRSEVTGWLGRGFGSAEQAAGLWASDVRSWPVVRQASGRVRLSVVTDVWLAARWGDVPVWLAHQAPPRLDPSVGTWTALRGLPAAWLPGDGLARGHLALRWSIAEYHGLWRPVELFASPWVEIAGEIETLATPDRPRWVGDGGASLTVAWGGHTSLRADAIVVPRAGSVPSGTIRLVLEQTLAPWD